MIGLFNVLISLASIFVFMIIMFFVAIIVKDNGIIDICWSLNFILPTLVSISITIFYRNTINITQIVLTVLILIWGLRLSYHIGKRNIGKGEDRRYKERRERWGKQFYVKTFFLIFMLQALWAAIIVSPVVVSNAIYPEVRNGWIELSNTPGELVTLLIPSVVGSRVAYDGILLGKLRSIVYTLLVAGSRDELASV